MGIGFVLAGLLAVVWGAIHLFGSVRHLVFRRTGVKRTATVVEHVSKPGNNNVDLLYEIYEYELDNAITRTKEWPVTTLTPVGQSVNLIVNRRNPQDALVEESLGRTIWLAAWGLALMVAGGLLIFAGLGLFMFRVNGS